MDDVKPWDGDEGQKTATAVKYMNQGQIRVSHPILISAAYVNCFMYTAHEFYIESGLMCIQSDAADTIQGAGVPKGAANDSDTYEKATYGSVWNFYPYMAAASSGLINGGQTVD